MEDRYEIRGKIAQGGLGSVYKAHDIRMSRDVALKRIATRAGDSSMTDEATRQLIKEASALASLQHPNIVTIYDVGQDEDGPFVVMELLTGQTLEEIICNASFTWEDFRQLAMQSLEALIAAQELHIVHRDIKPGNIMLTWLPSGKFQVKVFDFGLAKLSTKPSLQTIDQTDGVFGSIYFMGPEQFERIPIDHRVDLYAIGCVFYYALTGTYPFDGESAVEVMASHLQHHVIPIEEVREGIPLWVCNWIMWLINRQPGDRPESARDALLVFMQNDGAYISPELSMGAPAPVMPAAISKRPKLLIPGAATSPEIIAEPEPGPSPKKTASIPKPLTPPPGSKPSVHQTTQSYPLPEPFAPEAPPAPPTSPAPLPIQAPILPQTVATPVLTPPNPTIQATSAPTEKQAPALTRATLTGSASSSPLLMPVLKGASNTPQLTSLSAHPAKPTSDPAAQKAHTETHPTAADSHAPLADHAPKKNIPNSVKVVMAIVLTIVMTFLILFILNRKKENAEIALFNEMILLAAKESTTEVPVDKHKLNLLLINASSTTGQEDRSAIYNALALAKAVDKTDVDATITEYATTRDMYKDIRVILFQRVIAVRKNPSSVHALVNYAKSASVPQTALAAIEACRPMASETHFQIFLDILKDTHDEAMRKATENNMATIIGRSHSASSLRTPLLNTYSSSSNDAVKHSVLRLLGRVGGDQALEFVKQNLKSGDYKTKVAALGALGNWVDNKGFQLLMEYVASETNADNRKLAYSAAIKYATATEDKPEEAWKKIAEQAKSQTDQIDLINALASYSADPWVFDIMNHIVKTSSETAAVTRAEKAIDYLEKMKKAQGGNPKDKDK
jgi:serine/threonine protein kinase